MNNNETCEPVELEENHNHVIVYFEDNYGDEFDLEGVAVYQETDWIKILDRAKEAEYPCEISFGSNEFMEYDSFEDWTRCVNVARITETEYNEFRRILAKVSPNDSGAGMFLIPD